MNSLRDLVLVLTFILSISGCKTARYTVQTVERTHRDTLQHQTHTYDSIYIDRYQNINRSNDTVFIRDFTREYKYKFLKDTMRQISTDTIPVIHEVEVIKRERYIPSIYRWSLIIVIIMVIVIVCVIVIVIVKTYISRR